MNWNLNSETNKKRVQIKLDNQKIKLHNPQNNIRSTIKLNTHKYISPY